MGSVAEIYPEAMIRNMSADELCRLSQNSDDVVIQRFIELIDEEDNYGENARLMDEVTSLERGLDDEVRDRKRAESALDDAEAKLYKLQGFAKAVMRRWPRYGGVDADDLRVMALRHGLIESEEREAFCGDKSECDCRTQVTEGEDWVCYRKTSLLA